MKKIYVGLVVVFLTFCTSCKFKETIRINADGTGKVSFNMDGSGLMEMAGDEMGAGEAIDSVVSFKEILDLNRDSIAKLSVEEKTQLKKLEKFDMHMIMNAEKKQMNFDFFADFTSVDDLQDMFAAMNTASELDKGAEASNKSNPMSAFGSGDMTGTKYSYENNVFKRTVNIFDQKRLDSLQGNLGQAEMMFAASSYQLAYFFPKKIKSISLENAVISEDGKSFTAEINFMEYVKNPQILNVEITLED
jgi:hypothetical protein